MYTLPPPPKVSPKRGLALSPAPPLRAFGSHVFPNHIRMNACKFGLSPLLPLETSWLRRCLKLLTGPRCPLAHGRVWHGTCPEPLPANSPAWPVLTSNFIPPIMYTSRKWWDVSQITVSPPHILLVYPYTYNKNKTIERTPFKVILYYLFILYGRKICCQLHFKGPTVLIFYTYTLHGKKKSIPSLIWYSCLALSSVMMCQVWRGLDPYLHTIGCFVFICPLVSRLCILFNFKTSVLVKDR